MKITQFDTYTFPTTGLEFNTNFADLVPRINRMPGLDGGFDEFGDGASPREVGNVRYSFLVRAATASALATEIDTIRALARRGLRKLTMNAGTPTNATRFCWAKINNIQTPKTFVTVPTTVQRVTIDWSVPEPYWLTQGSEGLTTWGGGSTWGGGGVWGTAPTAFSGTSTSFNITPGGNGLIYPRIYIATGAGQTAENPAISRNIAGVAQEVITWTGTLNANETLEIDCRTLAARRNGIDNYSAFTFNRPWWMVLEPGVTNQMIITAQVGNAGTIRLAYFERWT